MPTLLLVGLEPDAKPAIARFRFHGSLRALCRGRRERDDHAASVLGAGHQQIAASLRGDAAALQGFAAEADVGCLELDGELRRFLPRDRLHDRIAIHSCTDVVKRCSQRLRLRRALRAAAPPPAAAMAQEGFATPVVAEVTGGSVSRPEERLAAASALSGLACVTARRLSAHPAPTRDAACACPAAPPSVPRPGASWQSCESTALGRRRAA